MDDLVSLHSIGRVIRFHFIQTGFGMITPNVFDNAEPPVVVSGAEAFRAYVNNIKNPSA